MRISNDLNYDSISEHRKIELLNDDGSVIRKSQNNQAEELGMEADTNEGLAQKQNLLPIQDVVDFAIQNDFNSDKELIGRDASLENLDMQKAISDMQRDNILREYQVFIQDPDFIDGVVRKISK